MRYEIIEAIDAEQLADIVNNYIAADWKPVGGPFVTESSGYTLFFQAVIAAKNVAKQSTLYVSEGLPDKPF